jgi:glutathione peroxidase
VHSNYPSLRYLYDTYHAQGLELIAFPANQFGGQAPGTDEEERAWAHKKFGFAFPVFDHIAVLDKPTPMFEGPTVISPVYRFLKDALPGEIPWNYTKCVVLAGRSGASARCCSSWAACGQLLTRAAPRHVMARERRFLVGRDGVPLRRYSPGDPLDQGMEKDIQRALESKPLPKRKSEQRR